MMEVLAYAAVAYLVVQLLVAGFNLLSGQYLKPGRFQGNSLVSLLIPARNEEKTIGNLLDDLKLLDYKNIEILVYDDESHDGTAAVIHEKSLLDGRIRYIRGNGLPERWLGKNYACDQLARQANGDYLLFLDADVRSKPSLLNDALAVLDQYHLDLLSVFPGQQMQTPGEWLTVPLMNRILIGNLPLLLVRKSRLPVFSAANGQFMLFRAETYKAQWFHQQVRNERVEDILIMRRMKKLGYKTGVLTGGDQISCRMYNGFGEGVNGFSKNIHAFFGKNWLIVFIYVMLTTLGPLAVLLSFSLKFFLLCLVVAILFRFLVSVQSRQTWWLNALLMPLQQLTLVLIASLAAYRSFTGNLTWKGRKVA